LALQNLKNYINFLSKCEL